MTLSFFRTLMRKLRLRPLDSGKPDSNVDAEAAAGTPMVSSGAGYPPGYVKDYDDGRPRH
jgi:hypothetical protein